MLAVPFLIYWLVVKDFFYDLDYCGISTEAGYCLSDSQCTSIIQGYDIGSCANEASDTVCCKITLNYFNDTYFLKPLHVTKSQTDTLKQTVLFSASEHSRFQIQYGNKTISNKKKIMYNPAVHVCEAPDKIIWPIMASDRRQGRHISKFSSGINQLYTVQLDKLDSGERNKKNLSGCSESGVSDDTFKLLINPTQTFSVWKFFTPEMQKFNTMNLTFDIESFSDKVLEPETRRRRSVIREILKQDGTACKNQQGGGDMHHGESQNRNDDVGFSQPENNHDTSEQNENYYSEIVESILDFESMHNQLIKMKDGYEDLTNDKSETIIPDTTIVTGPFDYSNNKNSDHLEKKESAEILRQSPDAAPVNEGSIFDKLNKLLQTEVSGSARSQDSGATHSLLKRLQIEAEGDLKKDFEIETSHDLHKPVKAEENYDTRRYVQIEATHDLRKPVQNGAKHDLRKPVQIESYLRKPVKTEASHDSRKPVQTEVTHDLRKPAQNDATHDLRKPVQSEVTHDLRKPVKKETSHDMRKPVSAHESHDLRWPVLEEETNLRNVDRDSGLFQNVLHGDKMPLSTIEKQDTSRHELYKKHDENLKLQDFFSNCKMNISFNNINVNLERLFEDKINQKQAKLKDLWKEALTVCGRYSGHEAETNGSSMKENWPWMVSLQENISGKFSHKCSGSLLNSQWVITVAHCVDMKPKSDLKLVMGRGNSELDKENSLEMLIDEIIVHPKFNRGMFENDLALLRLKTPIEFQPLVFPICLPWSIAELKNETPMFFGWELKYEQPYDDLQKLTLPVMTNYECEILYSAGKNKEKIKDTFLCVSKDDGNCDAESGSSLTVMDSEGRWSIIGLVSWGSACSNPEQPGVYIRISSYAQWIKDVIDCYEILM